MLKRICLTALFLAVCWNPSYSTEPVPPPPAIIFPEVLAPPPPPTPPPGCAKIGASSLYVIQSPVECVVLTSPPGLVSVTHEAGPIKLRGQFVGGKGVETRNITAKHVYILEATGVGKCELLVVPGGTADGASTIRRALDVDNGIAPPPPPPPGPNPPGPDPVAPLPTNGLGVFIVYETADLSKYPAAQAGILTSKTVRDYLNATCVVGPDGKTRQYRIWDKDTDATADQKLWQDALKRPRGTLPWIIISNGKTGFEGPLPANVADTLTLLKKYGG